MSLKFALASEVLPALPNGPVQQIDRRLRPPELLPCTQSRPGVTVI